MSRLISVVSVVGVSSLFFIGGDRADPMPSENERQGRSANIFFFHEGSLQGHGLFAFFFFSSCSSFLRGLRQSFRRDLVFFCRSFLFCRQKQKMRNGDASILVHAGITS